MKVKRKKVRFATPNNPNPLACHSQKITADKYEERIVAKACVSIIPDKPWGYPFVYDLGQYLIMRMSAAREAGRADVEQRLEHRIRAILSACHRAVSPILAPFQAYMSARLHELRRELMVSTQFYEEAFSHIDGPGVWHANVAGIVLLQKLQGGKRRKAFDQHLNQLVTKGFANALKIVANFDWLTSQEVHSVAKALVEVEDRYLAIEREDPEFYKWLDSLDGHGHAKKRASKIHLRTSQMWESTTVQSEMKMMQGGILDGVLSGRSTQQRSQYQMEPIFCGRERELNALKSLTVQNENGVIDFQVLVFTGQPGIGRSSLLRQFHKFLSKGVKKQILDANCEEEANSERKWVSIFTKAPDRNGVDFSVFCAIFRKIFGAKVSMTDEQLREVVKVFFAEKHPKLRNIPHMSLLNAVIQCDLDESEETSIMSPLMRRKATLALLSLVLDAYVDQKRLALLIDDAHLLDPGSLELIKHLTMRRSANLIVVLSLREAEMEANYPSYLRALQNSDCVAFSMLPTLEEKDVRRLLSARHKVESVESALVTFCLNKSRGVPFLLEQVDSSISEAGMAQVGAGKYSLVGIRLDHNLDTLQIDTTRVEKIIKSRLLELSREHLQVLQVAACFGGNANIYALTQIVEMLEVHEEIDVFRTVHYPNVTRFATLKMEGTRNCLLEFANRVVHRAVYDTIARNDREKIHGLIAKLHHKQVLGHERGSFSIKEDHDSKTYILLGMKYYKTRMSVAAVGAHWERANRIGRAFICFGRAGKQAATRGDFGSIKLYERCLALAAEVEDGDERISLQQVALAMIEKANALAMFSLYSEALKHIYRGMRMIGDALPEEESAMAYEITTTIILPELPRALCSCFSTRMNGKPTGHTVSQSTSTRLRIHAYVLLCKIAFAERDPSLLAIAANRLMRLCLQSDKGGSPLLYACIYKAIALRRMPLVSSQAQPLVDAFLEARAIYEEEIAGDLSFLTLELGLYLSNGMFRDALEKGYGTLAYFHKTAFSGSSKESFAYLQSCLPGVLAGHYETVSTELETLVKYFPFGAAPEAIPCALEMLSLCHFRRGLYDSAAATHDTMVELLAQTDVSDLDKVPGALYSSPVELTFLLYGGQLEECASKLIRGYGARMAIPFVDPPFYQRIFAPSYCCEQLLQDDLLIRDLIPALAGKLGASRMMKGGDDADKAQKELTTQGKTSGRQSFKYHPKTKRSLLSSERIHIRDKIKSTRGRLSDATRRSLNEVAAGYLEKCRVFANQYSFALPEFALLQGLHEHRTGSAHRAREIWESGVRDAEDQGQVYVKAQLLFELTRHAGSDSEEKNLVRETYANATVRRERRMLIMYSFVL